MHYYTLGEIPHKRHTIYRQPNGKLYSEELFSTEGFSNNYSLLYHVHPPTRVLMVDEGKEVAPKIAIQNNMQHRSYTTFAVKQHEDYLQSRVALLGNNDLYIGTMAPT